MASEEDRIGACMMRRFLLLFSTAALLCAQPDTSKRIDEILEPVTKPGTPGAAVAVIQNGKLAFQKGYGAANLEYNIAVTPDTVYHVASVSKQFTAMALVLLEQDGKLSLEDDIHKYLTELPQYGHGITIRNLLQHTSGIRDQWQTLGLAGWRLDDVITQKQILRMLFHQKELNFKPGIRHLNSNGGYTLAAEIVARVSGKPMPDFCDERIFKPLGMTRTHFHIDHRRIVPDRAYSYESAGSGYQASPLNYANVGATSLFTTAPDLAKWLDNFREPKVGGKTAITRLQEQAVLTNGTKIDYALGVSIGMYRGLKTISHGGGDAGYRSFVLWFPEQQLGVAVVSGLASFNSGSIANRVATVFLESAMKPVAVTAPAPARTYLMVDSAALERSAGYYRLAAGQIVRIAVQDGKPRAGPPEGPLFELKAVTSTRFYAEIQRVELEVVASSDRGEAVRRARRRNQIREAVKAKRQAKPPAPHPEF